MATSTRALRPTRSRSFSRGGRAASGEPQSGNLCGGCAVDALEPGPRAKALERLACLLEQRPRLRLRQRASALQPRDGDVERHLGLLEQPLRRGKLGLRIVLGQTRAEACLLGAQVRPLLARIELVDHLQQLAELLVAGKVRHRVQRHEPDQPLGAGRLSPQGQRTLDRLQRLVPTPSAAWIWASVNA